MISIESLLPPTADQDTQLPVYWRRETRVLRALAATTPITGHPEIFDTWCRRPARARVYRTFDHVAPGLAKAIKLVEPHQAFRLRDQAREEGVPITVLLNSADRVSPDIRQLRAGLGINLPWRCDDVVATYSFPGSGIGYHIGHEDGFIIQLAGRRHWRIYPPAASSTGYHLAVLGDNSRGNPSPPPRPESPPALDVELVAGDALYVPALHGHEGTTLEGGPSVSLSVAWRGMNTYRVLARALPAEVSLAEELDVRWYSLLPDLSVAQRQPLAETLAGLAVGTPAHSVDDLVARVLAVLTAGVPA